MLESVKEVVDSRVGNRVGSLIAYYSYDSCQINVIFVFLWFETCINYVKIKESKIPNNYRILFVILKVICNEKFQNLKTSKKWR